MFHLSERCECWYCRKPFNVRWPGQRFCRAHCRRMGKAIEGRAARRSWDDAGRPVQAETREAFDRDVAARQRIERGLWQPDRAMAAAAMVRRR
jgi:hypothetical protein